METVQKELVSLLKETFPSGIDAAVNAFLSAYWQLEDSQVKWENSTGMALNDLAERLEYYEKSDLPSFNGMITKVEAAKMIEEVITLAKSEGL